MVWLGRDRSIFALLRWGRTGRCAHVLQDEYGELRAALTAVQTEAADAAAAAAAEALALKKKHDARVHVRSDALQTSNTPCACTAEGVMN